MTTEIYDETGQGTAFVSIEPPHVDPPAEPTPEELIQKEFDAGISEVLGSIEDDKGLQPTNASVLAGMSEDDIKELFEKARRVDELEEKFTKQFDKAFGTIGGLKRNLDEFRNAQPTGGAPMEISKEKFQALSEYFDDPGVAEALAKDLAGLQMQGGGSDYEAKLAELRQEFQIELLSYAHSDWKEQYNSPEFPEWRATLSEDDQYKIDHSQSGREMAAAITSFKNWKEKRATVEQDRQQRLEDSIQPGGAGRGGRNNRAAEDAFTQGLNKVIGDRRRQ